MNYLSLDNAIRQLKQDQHTMPYDTYTRWKSTPPANYVNDIWRSYVKNLKPDRPLTAKLKQVSDTLKKFATDFVKQNEYKDLFIVEEDNLSYNVALNPATTNSSILNGIKRQYVSEDIADSRVLLNIHSWTNEEYDDNLIIRLFGSNKLVERESSHELYITSVRLVINESYTLPNIDTFNFDNIKTEFIKQVNIIKNLSELVKEYAKEQLEFMRLEKKIENDYREAMIDLRERSHKYISKFIKKGEIINSNSNYTCED
jgi:hypothetical protein